MNLFLLALGQVHAAGLSLPPPGWVSAPEVSFESVPASASKRPMNQPDKPHQVHARLIFDRETVEPGQGMRIGLHLEQDPNWHTYWKSPGDIGLPTSIAWSLPPGVSVGPYEYPAPHKFEFQGIISYGYEEEVLLFADVVFPDDMPLGDAKVGLEASWLVCEVSCIPGKVDLERTIEVVQKGQGKPGAMASLFSHAESFHPTDLPDGISIVGSVDPAVVQPEQPFKVTFDIQHPSPVEKDKTGWPFFVPITGDQWMILGTNFETIDGGTRITIDAETFAPEKRPTTDQVGGLFQFDIDGSWMRTEFAVPLEWSPSTGAVASLDAGPSAADPAGSEAETLPPAPPDQNFSVMLLMAFLGGILLNIMPCVLPVLSLKIYSLVEHADATDVDRQRAGMGYTIGVLISFLALGAVVITMRTVLGLQVGWGYQFQSPEYVIALATIVYVFGLSLFGVFEVPAFGASQMSAAQNKEGWTGHILTGAFATLLATPCSAPFLGTGMGFAFTLPSWGILLFFSAAGLGLAAPFLLVAYVPAMAQFLPKPGAWMETFKQFMGFTLMATTVWLVDVLGAQTGVVGAVGFVAFLLFVSLGCWIVGRWGGAIATDRAKVFSLIVALAVSTWGGWKFLVTDFAEPEVAEVGGVELQLDFTETVPWQPFTEERVEALAGHPVFIDFTADWCLSCKANEKTVLESDRVRAAMQENGVVPLKADWTRRDPVITKWLQRYGKAGVPFYLMLHRDQSKAAIALPEVITPGIVIKAFEQAQ